MKSTLLRVTLIVLVLLGTCQAADVDDFLDFSAADLPGRLYVPPAAESSARPVILFLHGAGETGTNNRAQINQNIDNLFDEAKDRGAFLYAPQATTVSGGIFNWDDKDRTDAVIAKLDQILTDQNADPNRIYVTGLSMGGGGTWNMVSRNPDRFAAAVPIAGVRVAEDFVPANTLGTPTWAFHARNDGVVSRRNSQSVVDNILAASGAAGLEYPSARDRETTFQFVSEDMNLLYTEYPTGNHGIWGRVYDTPELHDWMFAQAVPEPSSVSLFLVSVAMLFSTFRRRTTWTNFVK